MKNIINELCLRQYDDRDYDHVRELHFAGLKQTGSLVEDRTWDNDLLDIKKNYLTEKGAFYIALLKNEIIGMGGLSWIHR